MGVQLSRNLFKCEALWVDKRYADPLISLQPVLLEVCVSADMFLSLISSE